jgi:hypothetical protein
MSICASTLALASQPLETETARLLPRGWFKVDGVVEYQTSSEGHELDVPLAFEYGLSNRLELLVEPVVYTAIRPKAGPSATGFGDTEATLSWLVSNETRVLPAFAVAGEIKFPTTKNDRIGTGKTDYTPFLILSKRIGDFDSHLNLGYTIIGQPTGPRLKNTFDYALAGEYHAGPRWDLVAEVVGNTSSLSGAELGSESESAVTPEASGGEVAGTVGARLYLRPGMFFSLGVSYDNKHALLFRPGFTFRFK